MKLALRLLGAGGALLFGLAFAATFLSPIHYERAGRAFIQSKLEAQVRERIQFGGGRMEALARQLHDRNQAEIEEIRARMASGINARIAAIVAEMQSLGCECRQRMLQGLDASDRVRIQSLERAEPQLRRLIEGRYGAIVADLLRDLRIFTGTNLVAYLLLLLLSFLRPLLIRQLFIPGLLLAAATLAASGLYLFGQNWFFALLYNDFVGGAYAVWLLVIYAFLLDIGLNRARVTTALLRGAFEAMGTALKSAPC